VRRRQDIAIGAVVVAVLVGGVVLVSGGGGGGGEEQRIPLKKLVGQTIVGKMGQGGPDKGMLKQVRAGQLGSLIVLPHDAGSLKRDVARAQKAAREGGNPPLLIMIAQEGGYVKRLPGPPDTSPNDLGKSGDPAAARAEGQRTGSFLASLGVNVNLAPLMNVTLPRTADTIASRTYGSDEAKVAELGVAFIQGLQAGGVAATAKHFPGLGLSTVDTDFGRATVVATPAEQDAALAPFKAAIDAGVDLVMVSTAVYQNLGSPNPAALANAIVNGQLRNRFGFKGPIITDDLEGRSITDVTTAERAAVAALRAGDDLLLFAHQVNTAASAFRAVLKAAEVGQLDQAALQAAYDQVVAFKRRLITEGGAPAAG
jgi:beta-N-acetylhexosaminidase